MNKKKFVIQSDNKELNKLYRIIINASYRSDGINTEKFRNIKL